MDIFSVFTLLGGLAFFLYGMHVMSKSLEKLAGGRLERTLKRMTDKPFKSLALGAGLTAAIQSSSAVTVMLVGLVNSGVMELNQTIGVIMGSNIGTTFTAWILSLAGIDSTSFFLRLLKPSSFSPLLALAGIVMIMASKRQKKRDIGTIMVGFAVLMYGMQLMSGAVEPLADMPQFSSLLTAFSNPLLGILTGAVFTGIIQSSAASIGVLQALAMTGSITWGMALPIIMGQNIGTCVTALLACIGTGKNAQRVAVVHMSFNIIGTIVCLSLFYLVNAFAHFAFLTQPIGLAGIALCHTLFNLATTAMLLPFARQLEKLALKIIPPSAEKGSFAFLDPRLLRTPAVAISECISMTGKMAELARSTIRLSTELVFGYDASKEQLIMENEEKLDTYEDKLGTFLVQVASHSLTTADSRSVSKLLHSIGDFERIGDHAAGLVDVARELSEKDLRFSPTAQREITVLTEALHEIMDTAFSAWLNNDLAQAAQVEPLEQVIDKLIEDIRLRHIDRLQHGVCTIELGFILSDLLNNYERVSDHCSNIAVCVIEIEHKSFNTHEYLRGVKSGEDKEFIASFDAFADKYQLEPVVWE